MRSMDLIAQSRRGAGRLSAAARLRQGTKVAILGAGIAGLAASYEMRKAGFDCTVLEARDCRRSRLGSSSVGRKLLRTGLREPLAALPPVGVTRPST